MFRPGHLATPLHVFSVGLFFFALNTALAASGKPDGEFLIMNGEVGQRGGTLVFSQRSEPRTLNPLVASDGRSRQIIGLLNADLIHIDRSTQRPAPALASSWKVSPDRLTYTLYLRRGVRFSDGHAFTADDVTFTFQCYLDGRIHSSQRDLLIVGGKPIAVHKIDLYTVSFTLAKPYAAAERLFDGIVILPHHLLGGFDAAKLSSTWGLNIASDKIAGLGPFRLKVYVPGQRLVLERNSFYWKKDRSEQRLPYLDRLVSLFVGNEDTEALRFESGETDVVSRLGAYDYAGLEPDQRSHHYHLEDLGPGLEYDFLMFNENAVEMATPAFRHAQSWFEQTVFRKAVSSAIDRDSIVRLAYRGKAHPLAVPVTPGNKLWVDSQIPSPVYSPGLACSLLKQRGFSWTRQNVLLDQQERPIHFSLIVNAGNRQHIAMATLIQQDLRAIGIDLQIIALEFHTFLDRIFNTHRYEAAMLALEDGDADPNSEINVLPSKGTSHLWQLKSDKPLPKWQKEIDKLMEQQMVEPVYQRRKQLYDRAQTLVWENMPVIYLISPHVLTGAKDLVGNFRPAILSDHTLWNAEQLYLRSSRVAALSR